jgi:transposase
VDDAFQRFFKGLVKGRPKFKKARRYSSFTFPQSGYRVDGSAVTIDSVKYKFVKHREISGQIKTLTVKRGKQVVRIDRFAPTTKVCSGCGQKHHLTLRDRTLACDCGLTIDRDHNAAINIKTVGASTVCQSECKTRVRLRSRGDGRSLAL